MAILISLDHRNVIVVDGRPTGQRLTNHEALVLRAILSHERVANREFLLGVVYGGRDEPDIKILDVFVTKLRTKLGVHRVAIETVWGRGYCRNANYAFAPEQGGITVDVDAKLMDEIVAFSGGTPADVVARLLKAEHERIWSEAA